MFYIYPQNCPENFEKVVYICTLQKRDLDDVIDDFTLYDNNVTQFANNIKGKTEETEY